MKPQKKAVIGRKATKTSVVAKKRRASLEKSAALELKKEKRLKKLEKPEDILKKKIDAELKKKKTVDERKKEKLEKVEEKKQTKEDAEKVEKKCDKMIEKKPEEKEDVNLSDGLDKKKIGKQDDKIKNDKQCVQDAKKKLEKFDEKEEKIKSVNGMEDKVISESTIDERIASLPVKKRLKEEHKKREAKLAKLECKDSPKIVTAKDNKKPEHKKSPEKEVPRKPSPTRTKKEPKIKPPPKKNPQKKTVLATKKSHLPVVKKLMDKKSKLVKPAQVTETLSLSFPNVEATKDAKQAKKNSILMKGKKMLLKKFNDDKALKASKLPQKNTKANLIVKKEEKVKNGSVEKNLIKKKSEPNKDLDKNFSEIKSPKEESDIVHTDNIKTEIIDEKEVLDKIKEDTKKNVKSKSAKKLIKKSPKHSKLQTDTDTEKSDGTSDEGTKPQSKPTESQPKNLGNSTKDENDLIKMNLKLEMTNVESGESGSTSDSEGSDEDYARRSRSKNFVKKKERTPSEERAMTNRMKLFGFWSGPKRHRVASLNALAKVHCLYENENGGVYLGGFCKPKPEKEKDKETKLRKCKEEKEDKDQKKEKKCGKVKSDEIAAKRKLRNVPGLRGKHYDVLEGLTTSSSSSDEDLELRREREKERKKKERERERLGKLKEKKLEEEKAKEEEGKEEDKEVETVAVKKPKQKRRKKNAEVMDLKDMVVCKRMASLNASAILAASYSDEKNRLGTSSESSSSSESDVEFIKRRRQSDSEIDKRKQRQAGSDADDLGKPSKKVVIVNQDTDVTITGVYVNQTRSTHHEGFCSIAGMQYRISSTSHTQTAATAVATDLHEQKEQPCKSYTPLGALSSMQPPGTQGNHSNMSPRRHSAFSAPHQHGYYQPAGPLIQHPPTLPPVKAPPPEPTPTPPQNSEGSDDLVATSTTSGGTSSTGGGFYRAYCPQYYATPPQYQDLCYPPSYSHSHPHPPPYYHKYAPPYRRQYYGYQESGAGGGPGGSGAGPGVVEYQPPPGEYLPPYYGGYPPPPPPPPPPPNPAYMHSQGRPFGDPFQSCPCPMQSCPKNADTGPLIGNGKGAPVVSGPGLSLPPSALVGPPSPARGLAGLAPPHGANAWDTDRVQLNPAHRSHNQSQQQQQQLQQSQSQQQQQPSASSQQQTGHANRHNADCIAKGEKDCAEGKLKVHKCVLKEANPTDSKGEVKCEHPQNVLPTPTSLSNFDLDGKVTIRGCASSSNASTNSALMHKCLHQQLKMNNSNSPDYQHQPDRLHEPTAAAVPTLPIHHALHQSLKLENNQRVKCESCGHAERARIAMDEAAAITAAAAADDEQHQQHERVANCRVKCETGYKCEIYKCEHCVKEASQLAIMEMDKDSGILEDDAGSGKMEADAEVKVELTELGDSAQWKKPDYEATASEPVVEENGEAEDDAENGEKERECTNQAAKIFGEPQQQQHQPQKTKGQKVTKRKLSLDSLSDVAKLKKVNKRTLSVGSPREIAAAQQSTAASAQNKKVDAAQNRPEDIVDMNGITKEAPSASKKKVTKKENQSQKRKSDTPSSSETPPKKAKNTPARTMATDSSINETIDDVILQSVQMTEKTEKIKKVKNNQGNGKVQKKNKKNTENLLSTIKRASKKLDIVKLAVSEKVGQIKNEFKNNQQKINNKLESKLKAKNAKTKKVKAKLLEVKSKVLETKNNIHNKLPELKNNKIVDTKNNKFLDTKNNKHLETKNNKVFEKKNKVLEIKTNKILETKNINKVADAKNNKILEAKNDNKILEAKSTKLLEVKNNKVLEAKNNKNKSQDAKEPKDVKEPKESKDTKAVVIRTPSPINANKTKAGKMKSSAKKGKAQEMTKGKKKGKGARKSLGKKDNICKIEEQSREIDNKCFAMSRRPFLKPKWSNGWSWEGNPFEARVYLTNEETAIRRCYDSMRHVAGDVIRPLDCVLLRSSQRKADLPFVAKVAALWENPDDGEMMFSLLWYYRPEHTEQGRTQSDTNDEVFASRHRDANSVACIEDKCYILTFNEYCRYRKHLRRIEEGLECPGLIVPPGDQVYPRTGRQPPLFVQQDLVLFCRRVYDYRGKKLVKNPG